MLVGSNEVGGKEGDCFLNIESLQIFAPFIDIFLEKEREREKKESRSDGIEGLLYFI